MGNVISNTSVFANLMSKFMGSPGRDDTEQRAPVEKLGNMLRTCLKSGTVPHTFLSLFPSFVVCHLSDISAHGLKIPPALPALPKRELGTEEEGSWLTSSTVEIL